VPALKIALRDASGQAETMAAAIGAHITGIASVSPSCGHQPHINYKAAEASSGQPAMSHVINVIRHPTYIQLFYGEHNPEGQNDMHQVTHMEIRIRYDDLAKLPRRRFAPACRPLCGFDLRRWHLTCLLSCLLRRVHYRKMPAKIPVHGYTVWIHRGRRFERVKELLLKRVMTIAEQLAK